MKTNVFLIIGSLLFFTSCSARLTSSMQKTYAPLDYKEEVRVFEIGEEIPPNSEKLGTIKVDDSGFSTNCGYAIVLDKAKTESRRVGGNALKITEHKNPDLWSSCHRITADVYKVGGIENYMAVTGTADIDSASIAADYKSIPSANNTYKDIFPHFRFAVNGGGQYRTAPAAPGLNAIALEHYKKMRPGFHYDLQATYFFTESMGIEALFSQQFFGTRHRNISLTDSNGNFIGAGELNHKIAFNYIGANYVIRLFDSQKKNSWLFSFGFGYMGYNDRYIFYSTERMKAIASTLGTTVAVGYDIAQTENFGIALKLSLMGGSFRDYKQIKDGKTTNETLPDKTAEGLGTVKLSVGLRFNK